MHGAPEKFALFCGAFSKKLEFNLGVASCLRLSFLLFCKYAYLYKFKHLYKLGSDQRMWKRLPCLG